MIEREACQKPRNALFYSHDMSGREDEEHKLANEQESKVIQKGKARLIVAESEDAPQASSEPREIKPEPRLAVSQQAEVEAVDEPVSEVQRLERAVDPGKERIKVDKAKFEKLEKRLDEAEKQEEKWGEARGIGWWSILMGGVIVIILVIGAVAIRGVLDGATAKTEEIPPLVEAPVEDDPYQGSPEKWFRDRSGAIGENSIQVLKSFLDTSDDERSQWVRNPEFYLQHHSSWQRPLSPLLGNSVKHSWDIDHIGDTGYLVFKTRDEDFLPFRAYFTRDGDSLKLDWEATTAWSEVSLQAMYEAGKKRGGAANRVEREAGVVAATQLSPRPKSDLPEKIYTDSVLLRCMIRKRDEFYAGSYNDKEHSAYMLLSADKMHHMWGYAPKDSDLDKQLKSVLDHGSFVVKLKKDRRVTLRVRVNENEALPLQVELVELVNPEWVTP